MKCKLLAYNKEPLEIDVSQIARISGVSQSNYHHVVNIRTTKSNISDINDVKKALMGI